jgi:hypothetical protein
MALIGVELERLDDVTLRDDTDVAGQGSIGRRCYPGDADIDQDVERFSTSADGTGSVRL